MARLIGSSGVVVFDGTIENGGSQTLEQVLAAGNDADGNDITNAGTVTGSFVGDLSGNLDNGTQKLDGDGLDTGGADAVTSGGAVDTGGGNVATSGGNVSTSGGDVLSQGGDISTGDGGTLKTNLLTRTDTVAGLTIAANGHSLGFFGATPANQPEVPAIPTPQDIADALVALGLCTQAS